MIEERIRKILLSESVNSLIGENVYLLKAPDNTVAPYIEYEVISENGSLYAENEELYTTYMVQIDIFSEGNYKELVKEIKKVMKDNNFLKEFGGSLYEEKSKLFHYVLRFNYESEE